MEHSLSALLTRPSGRVRALRLLLRALAMRRSRLRLGELDDHLLRDIGLTRAQADFEAGRGSWNAPEHWLR